MNNDEISNTSPMYTGTTAASLPYECTVTSAEYLPLNDTFPGRCQHYQRCVHGVSESQQCPGNTEFSQASANPCDNPSNTTYCGARRALEPDDGSAGTGKELVKLRECKGEKGRKGEGNGR